MVVPSEFEEQLMAEFENDVKQNLRPDDFQVYKATNSVISTYPKAGGVIGGVIGLFAAFRVHSARRSLLQAFRAREQPTHVIFADARTNPIPYVKPLTRPVMFMELPMYLFAVLGGAVAGSWLATFAVGMRVDSIQSRDPECRRRLAAALLKAQAANSRRETDLLERLLEDFLRKRGGNGTPPTL
ncbi:hypothetical protein BJX61DRAFT_455718 [Aspergillus egyptiacus]|nr:hypothetical protein BJX61DRAFT_455718 [Aspergillus egyptiacus]